MPGENFSNLKHLEASPLAYRLNKSAKREPTDAMTFGQVVHMLVFEPAEYEKRVVIWCAGDRRGNEWKAFKAAHAEQLILKEEEAEEASSLALAITSKLALAKLSLEGGWCEPTLKWEDSGVGLKGRPDWVGPSSVIDLKTTIDASPRAFGNDCAKRLYHAQGAMYRDGLQAASGDTPPYFIVAAEKGSRDVVVYRVSEAILDAGRELYRGWLKTLKECRAANRWPGLDGGAESVPLVLPAWSVPVFEEASP